MTPDSIPGGTIMYTVGLVVLIGLAFYFAFMAANTAGLAEQEVVTFVEHKSYREAGQTYRTELIGGRTYVRPQARPEMYVLELQLDGQPAWAAVSRELWEAVEPGDRVQVLYQRRRITGAAQVLDVSR